MPVTPTAASVRVLLSAELLPLVGCFQDGFYDDMLPLAPFRLLPPHHVLLPYETRTLVTNLDKLHAVLTPWLRVHTISRVARLFEIMPRMVAHVASYAVYLNHMDLLLALDSPPSSLLSTLPNLLDVAVLGKSRLVVDYLLDQQYTRGSDGEDVLGIAAEHYDGMDLVQRLLAYFPRSTDIGPAVVKAAACLNTDIVCLLLPSVDYLYIAPIMSEIVSGHIDVVRQVIQDTYNAIDAYDNERAIAFDATLRRACMASAVQRGRIDVASWLLDTSDDDDDVIVDVEDVYEAACCGDVNMLRFVYEKYLSRSDQPFQFRNPNECEWSRVYDDAMKVAVEKGWLYVVEWIALVSKDEPQFLTTGLYEGMRNGHGHVVKWILEMRGVDVAELSSLLHIARSNVYVLDLLIKQFPDSYCIPLDCLRDYAVHGSAQAMVSLWDTWWSRERNVGTRTQGTHDVLVLVVTRRDVSLVKALVQRIGPESISDAVLDAAVGAGQLKTVRLLVETLVGGATPDEAKARIASEGLLAHAAPHADTLRYLIEMASTWQRVVTPCWLGRVSAKYGLVDLERKLVKGDQAPPSDKKVQSWVAMAVEEAAVAHDQLDVVAYLHDH
ncbi:Aste57867_23343 [Aphanomyces stellatus]|uniref:Aste57867_23343 protein n=1 Tax=Aphanomyces stellatus TaxID=120398 RepID=A0A485LMI2_9STRA|nr:hypothetical protein As57867_023272 [Aphanomyces stellatus]VFT99988.1 Aste57867_23343 [Aphanomyces stellatus]